MHTTLISMLLNQQVIDYLLRNAVGDNLRVGVDELSQTTSLSAKLWVGGHARDNDVPNDDDDRLNYGNVNVLICTRAKRN